MSSTHQKRAAIYRADITAGALKVPQSRIIAGLLLRKVNKQAWNLALFEDNVLQARNPETSRRLGRMIRQRLELMGPELWELVRDGQGSVSTHACLAATVKHSALLGDFLDLVVREQYSIFRQALSKRLWEEYIEDCRSRDPEMPLWSNSTLDRLRQSVFLVLAEAGYIEDTRTLKLQANHISSPLLRYLEKNHEDYVLRCIQVRP